MTRIKRMGVIRVIRGSFLIHGATHALESCMKVINAVLFLCIMFCLEIGTAHGAAAYTLKGVVITSEGTVVPKFTVIVKPVIDKPELVYRKRFNNGEFTVDGLGRKRYQIQVVSPQYVGATTEVNFASDRPVDYSIFILHKFRNEPRFVPDTQAYTISVKALDQKVPEPAREAYKTGVGLHQEGRLAEALMAYGQALRLCPNYILALSDIGSIYILFNRPESALIFLRRAQEVDRDNTIVRLNIAIALLAKREFSEATKILNAVLRAESQKSLPLYYLAKVQYLQKRYEQADQTIRKALEADPQMLDGWLLLFDIGMEQKHYDSARQALTHLREAMNNGTFSKFVDEQLAMLATN